LCADGDGAELGLAEVWSPRLRRAAERGELDRVRVRVAYSSRTAAGRLREARGVTVCQVGFVEQLCKIGHRDGSTAEPIFSDVRHLPWP
jgi:hypothetical protein